MIPPIQKPVPWWPLVLCISLGTLLLNTAHGHTLSKSFSLWKVASRDHSVQVTIDARDLASMNSDLKRLHAVEIAKDPKLKAWILSILKENIYPGSRKRSCASTRGEVFAINTDTLVASWKFQCPREDTRTVTSELFRAKRSEHLHFITWEENNQRHEAVLSSSNPSISFARPPAPKGIKDFIDVGLEHVLEGYDHILFVLALVILGGTIWTNLLLATGFTAGHSITLALASLGVIQVHSALVEILVAISVAFAGLFYFHSNSPPQRRWMTFGLNLLLHAAALFWTASLTSAIFAILGSAVFTSSLLLAPQWKTLRHQLLIALSFGLVHGFAFASAFGELLGGSSLVLELLGFNIGVELGQIAIVLIAAILLSLGRRAGAKRGIKMLSSATAACILAMGIQWTFTRLLGL